MNYMNIFNLVCKMRKKFSFNLVSAFEKRRIMIFFNKWDVSCLNKNSLSAIDWVHIFWLLSDQTRELPSISIVLQGLWNSSRWPRVPKFFLTSRHPVVHPARKLRIRSHQKENIYFWKVYILVVLLFFCWFTFSYSISSNCNEHLPSPLLMLKNLGALLVAGMKLKLSQKTFFGRTGMLRADRKSLA